jgi:RNA polymerase sigma-70 factor (ECF subfamily)
MTEVQVGADDDELMAAFCRGDERAFDALYARHAQPVHAFLRRMVGRADLADDLLQTTFLSMVRARGRYQAGTQVRSWLLTIAANAARDALRRAKVRDLPASTVIVAEQSVEPELPDPAATRALESALQSLSAEQREAVVLHKLHDLSFDEVATVLGIKVSAAKVRAHRGYERLRALLRSSLGEGR